MKKIICGFQFVISSGFYELDTEAAGIIDDYDNPLLNKREAEIYAAGLERGQYHGRCETLNHLDGYLEDRIDQVRSAVADVQDNIKSAASELESTDLEISSPGYDDLFKD